MALSSSLRKCELILERVRSPACRSLPACGDRCIRDQANHENQNARRVMTLAHSSALGDAAHLNRLRSLALGVAMLLNEAEYVVEPDRGSEPGQAVAIEFCLSIGRVDLDLRYFSSG